MLDFILSADAFCFHLLNGAAANPFFDLVMPVITESRYWLPVYIFLFVWLLWKRRREGLIICLMLAIGVVIGDQFNSMCLKEWVGRIRPCHALDNARLVGVVCGAGKSFPSSHAVNNFMAAALLAYFYPKNKIWWFFIASAVAYSRIYVGVHYPLDAIAGAIEGVLISLSLISLQRLLSKRSALFTARAQPYASP